MSCTAKLPCFTQPTFDYRSMACFLQNNMKYANTGIRVVVMIKDKYNPGKYKYIEKPVMHLISKDSTSSTVMAYIIPGYDNDYNYMYVLSKTLRKNNIFSGEHFTMGLRNGTQFDIHYTTYDYRLNSKPSYLFYDLVVHNTTTPSDIAHVVCTTQMHPYDDVTQRCHIIDNLMKYVHENESCAQALNSQYTTMSSYGGSRSKKSQKGGNALSIDEVDEPFKQLIQYLEDKLGGFQNLQSVEMQIINNNKGLITYCLENEQVESMYVSASSVEKRFGDVTTYYALPFDFTTYEFIAIEELVASIPGYDVASINNYKSVRIPLKDLDTCGDRLDYETILNMATKTKINTKTCQRTAPRIIPAVTPAPIISVTSGGNKKKSITKKQSKRNTKS